MYKAKINKVSYKRVLKILENEYGWLGLDECTDMQKELIRDVIKSVCEVLYSTKPTNTKLK